MSRAFVRTEVVSYEESLTYTGKSCRIGTGWQTLANIGDYLTLHFHTPVSGMCFYAFSTVQKTGDELEVTLVEGGTYSNGTPTSAYNLNRKYRDVPCVYTDLSYGTSPTTTISGGLSAPPNGLAGVAQGNAKPGGTQEGGKFIILENDTDYTLKITAIGTSTKVLALTTLAHI